ncbi:MAG: winged helix-turn-helix domain-containing protein [Acidobacteriota bacterium]|jgi:DNA-binding response OmpR family regulator|nr:winged helix-turn-helix domain-containing protein [Bryobacteraceae bacterium CoA2 C42]MCA2962488.1 winged helix-turn-helix transcriptional regulator [Acidobacteriaceae bacterium]
MDTKTTTLSAPPEPLHLTKKESELLTVLRQHAGNCLSRDYLLHTIWGYTGGVRTRTLDVHVQRLRRKVKMFNLGGEIQTVLRHGYCWVPQSA